MVTCHRYEVIIYWSDEDEAFIAEVPELPGCAADGATYEEALANVQLTIADWIETATDLGRVIPEAHGRLTLRKSTDIYFLLCVEDGGYPVALEACKVYRAITDTDAESHGLVRVVDGSGESYLFPKSLFVPIKVPEEAEKVFDKQSFGGTKVWVT